jgi:Domain of Unknown Function (DUF1080)
MRWLVLVAASLIGGPTRPAAQAEPVFKFAKDDIGRLPRGWKAEQTGKGEGSVWKVVADPTAPSGTGLVLAQTAQGPRALFNLCVADGTRFKNGRLRVAFKAVAGKEDQGGGLVWRYRDANNYYVARMNPLEDNFRVYKVVNGRRTQLATTKDDVKVAAGTWHTLEVRVAGDHIEGFLDGKKYLDVRDATFPAAGAVGLWSKADAQTRFDGLSVKED